MLEEAHTHAYTIHTFECFNRGSGLVHKAFQAPRYKNKNIHAIGYLGLFMYIFITSENFYTVTRNFHKIFLWSICTYVKAKLSCNSITYTILIYNTTIESFCYCFTQQCNNGCILHETTTLSAERTLKTWNEILWYYETVLLSMVEGRYHTCLKEPLLLTWAGGWELCSSCME